MPFTRFGSRMIGSYRSAVQRLKRNFKVRNEPLPGSSETSLICVISSETNSHFRLPSPIQSLDSIQNPENEGEQTDSVPNSRPRKTFAEPFLNQKLCKLCGYGVNLGFLVGVHPFHLNTDEEKGIISIVQKSCNSGWWLGMGLIVDYLLYLMYQLVIRFTSYEGLDFDEMILWYTLALMLLPLVFQVVSMIHRDLLAGLVNRSVQFCFDYAQLFDDDLRKTESAELKIAITFLQSAYFGLALLLFLVTCVAIAKPDLCTLPSSLCLDPISSCHIPMRISSLVLLILIELVYVAGSTLYAAGLALVLCISPAISHLNVLHAKRNQHRPCYLIGLYRQLYLLFEDLNQLISMPLLPTLENVFVTLTVFGLYGALRTSGVLCTLMFAVACVAFTCLILLFWALAKIHSASLEVLGTWKRDLRFSERELASIRPIRIRLASYGYVDAGIMITIIEVIFNNAITLLITT